MAETRFKSLTHFSAFTTGLSKQFGRGSSHNSLEKAGKLLEERAKQVIGTYELGWQKLAQSTQEDRVRKGFPADEPLLRTGSLRDSIHHKIEGDTVHVGSDSNIAMYQEFGTRTIPPRSFLRKSAIEKEHEIVNILKRGLLRKIKLVE